jgi:hypothetical protein
MFELFARPTLPLAALSCAFVVVRAAVARKLRAADDAAATRAAVAYRDALYTGTVPAWVRHVG